MKFNVLRSTVVSAFTATRKVIGFALVFAAFAGMAQAVDIPTADVPEMDPGTMGSALTLFLGGLILLKSRLNRR